MLDMSNQPSAPPPSYNDVLEKGEVENIGHPIGFQSSPSNHGQYNYSQVPLNQPPPIQAQPQPQVVIMQQADPTNFGPHPIRMVCPSCKKNIVTRVEYQTSAATHVLAGVLCCMGCCCLAPIPYFVDACKNCVHYCSDCGDYLGTFSNIGNRRNRGYYDY